MGAGILGAWKSSTGVPWRVSVDGSGECTHPRKGLLARRGSGGLRGELGEHLQPQGAAAGRTLAFYFCNWPSCALPKPLPVGEAAPTPQPPRPAWDGGEERGGEGMRGEGGAGGRRPPSPPGSDRPGTGPAPRPPRVLLLATPGVGFGRRDPPDSRGRPRGRGPFEQS